MLNYSKFKKICDHIGLSIVVEDTIKRVKDSSDISFEFEIDVIVENQRHYIDKVTAIFDQCGKYKEVKYDKLLTSKRWQNANSESMSISKCLECSSLTIRRFVNRIKSFVEDSMKELEAERLIDAEIEYGFVEEQLVFDFKVVPTNKMNVDKYVLTVGNMTTEYVVEYDLTEDGHYFGKVTDFGDWYVDGQVLTEVDYSDNITREFYITKTTFELCRMEALYARIEQECINKDK